MAKSSRAVEILIRVKDRAKAGVQGVNKSVESLKGSVFNLKTAFAGLGAGLAVKDIVSGFAAFDDQMRQTGAIAGATGEELQAMTALAEEMGSKTRYSATEAGEALMYLSMAGLDTQQGMAALPGVLTMAAANMMDLGTAADIATNVLSGMGLPISELARVNDVLTKAAHSANTNVTELGEAMKVAGPAAKGSKMELEPVAAILGGLADNGIKGAEAGHAVKRMLIALQDPSGEAAETLNKLNIETRDSEGNFRGLTPILKDLGDAQIDLTTSTKIFGKFTGTAAVAAAGYAGKIGELEVKLNDAAGTAGEAADKMEAGLGGAIRSLMSAWDAMKNTIGAGFGDELTEVLGYVRSEINGLKDAIVDMKKSGDFANWTGTARTAFDGLFAAGKAVAKTFVQIVDALEPFIARGAEIAPVLVKIAAGMWAFQKATLAVEAATVLTSTAMGTKLGAALAANIASVNMNTKVFGIFRTATLSVGSAFTLAAAAVGAFFAGWQIGKLINQMKLFGDGTVKVSARIQHMFEMLGGEVSTSYEKNLDRIIAKTSKFAAFRLPVDFAKAADEQLVKYNESLAQTKRWLDANIEKQKIAIENARHAHGTNSETYKAAEKSLERFQKSLDLVEKSIAKVSKEEKKRADQTAANTKKKEEAAQKEVVAVTAALAEIGKGYEEETAVRAEELQKQLDAVDAAGIEEIRSRKAVNDEKAGLDDLYNTATISGAMAYVTSMQDIHMEEVERKREAVEAKQELEEQFLKDSIARNETFIAQAKGRYDGEIKAKLDANKELSQAEKDLVEEYEKAQERRKSLEAELSKFKMESAKNDAIFAAEAEDARVRAVEEAHQRIVDAIRSETSERNAEQAKAYAMIDLQEAQGVLSVQQAADKKKQLEKEWAEFKVRQAEKAVRAAVAAYGRESAEYKAAVTERTNAEADMLSLKAELAKAENEQAAATEKSAAAAKQYAANFTAAGEALKKLFSTKTDDIMDLTPILIQADEAKNSLQEALMIAQSAADDMAKYGRSIYMSAFAETASHNKAAADALVAEFNRISVEASAAGLSVDSMDMTLEQAAQNAQSRIGAWKSIKDEIRALNDEFASLDFDVAAGDGLAETKQAFADIKAAAAGLSDEMATLNEAFGSGNLSEAKEMADGVIESYRQIYDRAADYLDALKSEWDEYYGRVQSINEQIVALNMSTEERIRELKRETMSEEAQWHDRKMEYEEQMAAARQAAAQGQHDAAQEYYDKAMGIAESLAEAVTDSAGETVMSLESNTTLAIDMIEQARSAASENLNRYAAENEAAMKQTEAQIESTVSWMDTLGAKIGTNIAQAEKMKTAMNFSEFANQQINTNFTGTGSSERPIMDKIREIKEGAAGMVAGIQQSAANIDFSQVRRGLENAASSVAASARGGTGSVRPGDMNMRDYGRIELKIGGKGLPVMGERNVIGRLKTELRRESLVGSN